MEGNRRETVVMMHFFIVYFDGETVKINDKGAEIKAGTWRSRRRAGRCRPIIHGRKDRGR